MNKGFLGEETELGKKKETSPCREQGRKQGGRELGVGLDGFRFHPGVVGPWRTTSSSLLESI